MVVGLVVAFVTSIISVFIPDDRSNDGNYVDSSFKLFCSHQFKTNHKDSISNAPTTPFIFRLYWWTNISSYCRQVFHQYGIFRNLYLECRIISNIHKVSMYILVENTLNKKYSGSKAQNTRRQRVQLILQYNVRHAGLLICYYVL